jgi:hypothetical protein
MNAHCLAIFMFTTLYLLWKSLFLLYPAADFYTPIILHISFILTPLTVTLSHNSLNTWLRSPFDSCVKLCGRKEETADAESAAAGHAPPPYSEVILAGQQQRPRQIELPNITISTITIPDQTINYHTEDNTGVGGNTELSDENNNPQQSSSQQPASNAENVNRPESNSPSPKHENGDISQIAVKTQNPSSEACVTESSTEPSRITSDNSQPSTSLAGVDNPQLTSFLSTDNPQLSTSLTGTDNPQPSSFLSGTDNPQSSSSLSGADNLAYTSDISPALVSGEERIVEEIVPLHDDEEH